MHSVFTPCHFFTKSILLLGDCNSIFQVFLFFNLLSTFFFTFFPISSLRQLSFSAFNQKKKKSGRQHCLTERILMQRSSARSNAEALTKVTTTRGGSQQAQENISIRCAATLPGGLTTAMHSASLGVQTSYFFSFSCLVALLMLPVGLPVAIHLQAQPTEFQYFSL